MINMQTIQNTQDIINAFNNNYKKLSNLTAIYSELALRMITKLDFLVLTANAILDLGSGMNLDAKLLYNKYPNSKLYTLDTAINVLKYYRSSQSKLSKILQVFKKQQFTHTSLNANIMSLPIIANSMDIVYSNLTMPYLGATATNKFAQYQVFFNELARVLKQDGIFLISGLSVASLQELRNYGLSCANLPDMHDIGDLLNSNMYFNNIVIESDILTISYDNYNNLKEDLKIVAANLIPNSPNTTQIKFNKTAYLSLLDKIKNHNFEISLEIYYAYGVRNQIEFVNKNAKTIPIKRI